MEKYRYDEWFDLLLRDIGEPQDCQPCDENIIEKYKDKLPKQLFKYWRELGWCSYGDGLFWMVNPDEYQEILNSWLSETVFENRDDLSVIARNAFGELYVWCKGKSDIFFINTAVSAITYDKEEDLKASYSSEEENGMMRRFWGGQDKEYLDLEDEKEKPLFDRCLKKFGRLKRDEIYGFKLHPNMSGSLNISNIEIMKLESNHYISMQMAEVEWIPMD